MFFIKIIAQCDVTFTHILIVYDHLHPPEWELTIT
jgi:hypothetical protein